MSEQTRPQRGLPRRTAVMKYLVLYYDGNNTKAKLVIHDRPEEIVRETIGCPPFGDITAIVQMPEHTPVMWVEEREADMALICTINPSDSDRGGIILYPEDC